MLNTRDKYHDFVFKRKGIFMTKELVTIGIPVYNMECSVLAAIQSALAQTYSDIEVLIVDDGSTDKSIALIRENINDPRVKIYEREQNGGVCAAMRDLVDNASGKYICFLDADDTMMPTRVEKQLNAIKSAEAMYPTRMVASFCGSIVNNIQKKRTYTINPNDLFKREFGGGTGHSMYRVADLQKLGNFDTRFSRSADAAMCINFLMNNGFYAMVAEPLITYNFVWNKAKRNVQTIEEKLFDDMRQTIRSDNPQNLYLRRFCGLPFTRDYTHTHIDLFGIKGLRILSIRHKNGGTKHIVRLFGLIPLLRIKSIED